ncbi:unnamed protein product, partial [Prorocentrum cordatum]
MWLATWQRKVGSQPHFSAAINDIQVAELVEVVDQLAEVVGAICDSKWENKVTATNDVGRALQVFATAQPEGAAFPEEIQNHAVLRGAQLEPTGLAVVLAVVQFLRIEREDDIPQDEVSEGSEMEKVEMSVKRMPEIASKTVNFTIDEGRVREQLWIDSGGREEDFRYGADRTATVFRRGFNDAVKSDWMARRPQWIVHVRTGARVHCARMAPLLPSRRWARGPGGHLDFEEMHLTGEKAGRPEWWGPRIVAARRFEGSGPGVVVSDAGQRGWSEPAVTLDDDLPEVKLAVLSKKQPGGHGGWSSSGDPEWWRKFTDARPTPLPARILQGALAAWGARETAEVPLAAAEGDVKGAAMRARENFGNPGASALAGDSRTSGARDEALGPEPWAEGSPEIGGEQPRDRDIGWRQWGRGAGCRVASAPGPDRDSARQGEATRCMRQTAWTTIDGDQLEKRQSTVALFLIPDEIQTQKHALMAISRLEERRAVAVLSLEESKQVRSTRPDRILKPRRVVVEMAGGVAKARPTVTGGVEVKQGDDFSIEVSQSQLAQGMAMLKLDRTAPFEGKWLQSQTRLGLAAQVGVAQQQADRCLVETLAEEGTVITQQAFVEVQEPAASADTAMESLALIEGARAPIKCFTSGLPLGSLIKQEGSETSSVSGAEDYKIPEHHRAIKTTVTRADELASFPAWRWKFARHYQDDGLESIREEDEEMARVNSEAGVKGAPKWGKRKRLRHLSRAGCERARPYFDAEEEEPEASGAHAPANHYFGAPAARAEDDASAEAGAPRGHYFQEPAPLARGGGAEARASGGRSPYVGEADGGVLSEEVLQRFQPFFDAVEVVTPAQRCSAAAFLDEHGATAPEDLVLCGLAEAFTAALELKPVPRAKAARLAVHEEVQEEHEQAELQRRSGSKLLKTYLRLSFSAQAASTTRAAPPGTRALGAARGRGAARRPAAHYFGAPSAGEERRAAVTRWRRRPAVGGGGAAAAAADGCGDAGGHAARFEGELWGRVVGQDVRNWKLASGRSAKKETFGVKWYWDAEGPPEGSPPAAPAAGPSQDALGPSALDALAERRRRDEAALAARREAAKQGRRTRDVRAQVERE